MKSLWHMETVSNVMFNKAHVTVYVWISENISLDCGGKGGGNPN